MLQCLERGERVAFVLGGIFELPSAEAAWILGVTPAAYRKRLERARQRLRAFMNSTCGIVNPEAFRRCHSTSWQARTGNNYVITDAPMRPKSLPVSHAAARGGPDEEHEQILGRPARGGRARLHVTGEP